jgi:hypothetical protein
MDHPLVEKIVNDVGSRMFVTWYGRTRKECISSDIGIPRIVIAHDEKEAIDRAFSHTSRFFRYFAVELKGASRPVEIFTDGRVLPIMEREWAELNEQLTPQWCRHG